MEVVRLNVFKFIFKPSQKRFNETDYKKQVMDDIFGFSFLIEKKGVNLNEETINETFNKFKDLGD